MNLTKSLTVLAFTAFAVTGYAQKQEIRKPVQLKSAQSTTTTKQTTNATTYQVVKAKPLNASSTAKPGVQKHTATNSVKSVEPAKKGEQYYDRQITNIETKLSQVKQDPVELQKATDSGWLKKTEDRLKQLKKERATLIKKKTEK